MYFIPEELKSCPQWVVWRFEDKQSKKPTKVPYSPFNGTTRANVNDSSTYGDYLSAVDMCRSGWFDGIGFVLTKDDPFAFIDLDDTEGDFLLRQAQYEICQKLNSYTEFSPSGKGVHVIVRGSLPCGRKRNKVEMYSSGRFMTFTGNHIEGCLYTIEDRNKEINDLFCSLGGKEECSFYDPNSPETKTDSEILSIASNAENGEKFDILNSGDWQSLYPSQSEADFAYINIIAFYTQNREQIKRIFRNSQLGQRDKAKRDDYVSWMINKSFDRMLPPVDIESLITRFGDMVRNRPIPEPCPDKKTCDNSIYSVPPGLMGEIAQYIYTQAPRPVPEIALAAAIGLMAGICGRAYNVSSLGLNQYIMLLASTGTGKEAMAQGIDKIMGEVYKTVPAAIDFIGPAQIASAQALIKYMSKGPTSFVSIMGEIGLMLQQLNDPRAPAHLIGLKAMLLDMFNKSGHGSVLRPSIYSDKEKNTESVLAPSFTILGESTPERFYESFDEMSIAEGLLPRFTIIEYQGNRPPLNKDHVKYRPSGRLIERVSQLCAQCSMLNNSNKVVNVAIESDAASLFESFDKMADRKINAAERESVKQLWNRAHIKSLKLAALVAVGCDPYNPIINIEMAKWSIRITENDVERLQNRFESGFVGKESYDVKQIDSMKKVLIGYFTGSFDSVSKYGVSTEMFAHKVIPFSFVQRRLVSCASYRNSKINATECIKRSIKTFVDVGALAEIGKRQAFETFGTRSLCYALSDINTLESL